MMYWQRSIPDQKLRLRDVEQYRFLTNAGTPTQVRIFVVWEPLNISKEALRAEQEFPGVPVKLKPGPEKAEIHDELRLFVRPDSRCVMIYEAVVTTVEDHWWGLEVTSGEVPELHVLQVGWQALA